MDMNIDPDLDYYDDEDGNVSIQPPDMPQNCRKKIQSIGGTNTILLAHKSLSSADVGGVQNQSFSIPNISMFNYAFQEFLRDDEKMLLNSRDQYGFPNAVNTILLDTSWDAWNVPLRKLVADDVNINHVYEYELGEPWLGLVRENELIDGDVVQLWAFRVGFDRQLWLALIKVEGAEHDELSLTSLNIR